MPDLDENRERWDGSYHWDDAGDEWSSAWGGVAWQWAGTLFPRLQGFLPARRIVEIAPGFGRWTSYLVDHCEELIGIDLSGECVEACRRRFAGVEHASFATNDGKSLPGVSNYSVDLVFSYDSLVHVESDVIGSYLGEIGRVLADDGVAVLHHSNIATYPLAEAREHNEHWRGESVSGALVEQLAGHVGLSLASQETHVWGGNTTLLTDCLSVLCRPGSRFDAAAPRRYENWGFTDEMRRIRKLSERYPAPR